MGRLFPFPLALRTWTYTIVEIAPSGRSAERPAAWEGSGQDLTCPSHGHPCPMLYRRLHQWWGCLREYFPLDKNNLSPTGRVAYSNYCAVPSGQPNTTMATSRTQASQRGNVAISSENVLHRSSSIFLLFLRTANSPIHTRQRGTKGPGPSKQYLHGSGKDSFDFCSR